jgi:hypothetical protein
MTTKTSADTVSGGGSVSLSVRSNRRTDGWVAGAGTVDLSL